MFLIICGLVIPYGDVDLDQHLIRQQVITWTDLDFPLMRVCFTCLRTVAYTGWETSARPLANMSENMAGRV